MKILHEPITYKPKFTDLKYLILEDVYYDDIFEKLTEYILYKLDNSNIVQISFNDLLSKLPDWWSGKRYFKRERKILLLFKYILKTMMKLIMCYQNLNLVKIKN